MTRDTRVGKAILADLLGTWHLATVPKCAKCVTRSRMRRLENLQGELRELFDLLNLPPVLRGHSEDGSGYSLSQLGKR